MIGGEFSRLRMSYWGQARNGFGKGVKGDRLGNVGRDTQILARFKIFWVEGRSHDHHRGILYAGSFSDLAQEVDTAHPRQYQVQENGDEITERSRRRKIGEKVKSFPAVVEKLDVIIDLALPQLAQEQSPIVFVVLNDYNPEDFTFARGHAGKIAVDGRQRLTIIPGTKTPDQKAKGKSRADRNQGSRGDIFTRLIPQVGEVILNLAELFATLALRVGGEILKVTLHLLCVHGSRATEILRRIDYGAFQVGEIFASFRKRGSDIVHTDTCASRMPRIQLSY
jgi:hypothetical protein